MNYSTHGSTGDELYRVPFDEALPALQAGVTIRICVHRAVKTQCD
jgi:hypothetical protein